MILLQINEATAAQRRIPIYLVDVTDGFTPEPGLSTGFTIEVSENGAAQASGGGSISEIGEGQYYYEASAAELSTLGFLAISIRHANCRDFFAVAQVVAFDPYTAYSIHNAADIWTAGSRALSTPNDYKATGFSTHNADAIWAVVSREITGGVLTTPADYKATGFSVHSAADVWTEITRTITGGVLTTPNDYKATGFSTHNEAAVWTTGGRELSTPNNYKANVSALSLEATVNALNNLSSANIQTILETNDLDHLLKVAHPTGDPVANTIFDLIMNKDVNQTFVRANDSLEAIRDRGDDAWTTGGAGGIDAIINVIPSIPSSIDVSNTKLIRLALYIYDSIDDLPTTAEITPGTITIDRSADGGTSWSTIVNVEACLEHAGCIYYDEVFNSGAGYASADMIRITFKGQKVTIATNDFEIADVTNGIVFNTRMDSGLSGGGPSAGDIADAVWEEPIVDHSTGTTFGGKNQKVVPSETIADYNATGFSTHSADDVWSVVSKIITGGVLTTPNDYKASVTALALEATVAALNNITAADVWAEVSKVITGGVLTTPADYKANVSGLAPANEYDTELIAIQSDLDNPNQYKATGFSTHSADDVWAVVSKIITGGVLTTPGDYKASVTSLALEATVNALNNITAGDVWSEVTKEITGGVLTTPDDYKANVSALALEATVLAIKALTDNLPANTELELIKLKGVGGIWLVAEYHHNENNDNDYIQFWQYGNQADFDNETKVNAVNKWRQDITYSTNLPIKSKWDKVT